MQDFAQVVHLESSYLTTATMRRCMTVKMIVRAAVLENILVKVHTNAIAVLPESAWQTLQQELRHQPALFVIAEPIQHHLLVNAQIVLLENSSLMMENWQVSTIASSVAGLAVLASIQGQHRRHAMAAMLERTW